MDNQEQLDLAETIDRLQEENCQLRSALAETDCGRVLLRQKEEFARLLAASKLIVAELDPPQVFTLVADHARQIVGAELVLVPMLNESRDRYTYVAASGTDAEQVCGTGYSATVGMCGWVLQNERSLLFGEKSSHWMAEKTPWEKGQQSAVLVPLFGRERIIGGLSALGKEGGGAFTLHDLDLLTMFANQVSNAIENALLFRQRLEIEQGLQAVNDCFLSFGADPLDNIRLITETTGRVLGATCVLYNRRDGDLLKTMAGWQLPPDMVLPREVQGRLCLDALAKVGEEPLIVRDLQNSPYAETDPNIRRYGLQLYVGYPVRSADKPASAILCTVFQNATEISAYQLSLLSVLGRAAAVEEERLRAELALRASEGRFRSMIENASVGILAADTASTRLLYANPVICQMLGYGQDELLALDISAIHPAEDLEQAEQAFFAQVGLQTRCRRKDESLFAVDIKPVAMELDGRKCLVGFFTDISERHLLEAERLKSQKLEAIGMLAGGIAHDFNNLLQAIFGYIFLAKEGMEPRGRPLAMLEQAESALQQSVNLTNQLLTFSKGGKPVKRITPLQPLIAKSTQFILSGSHCRYQMDLPPDLWPAEVDAGQVGQVVQNIVLNADQAMPEGGTVTVTASNVAAADPALPPVLPPADYVRISVRDSGMGITEEHLARIFDPYFTTKDKGNGLGLATSYSIVKNHAGIIAVQSRPGEGSTFNIYLPASPGASLPEEDAAPATDNTAHRSLSVLLMDDDDTLRELCGEMLARLGHDAEVTCHGEETIARYQAAREEERPFDVVILDLTIRGGMGGEETLGRLRSLDPGVRAIVSSGYSETAAMANHQAHGFRARLLKPYSMRELQAALNAATA